MSTFPEVRLRRLRRTPALRQLFDLPMPGPEKFMWPVFIKEGTGVSEPIEAMPGQRRMSVDVLLKELAHVVDMGVGSVLVFGLVEGAQKDGSGTAAYDDQGTVQQAIRRIRKEFPELVIASDVCVCAYTSHGHCGPLTGTGDVDNDASNVVLAKMAVSHAAADRGWGDLNGMVRESTMALSRAGADIIISYWANQYDEIFKKG